MYKLEIQIQRHQLTARAHARLMREINRRVMERQRDQRVPLHFEEVAYSRYGARARSSGYNKSKMRTVGHRRPNVFTGRLKRSLRFKITATQHGSKLTMRASVGTKIPAEQWNKMSQEQQAKANRKRRRLAKWQKEEIARLSRDEIKEERTRQAREYRWGATSPAYKRKRMKRTR